jgi:hypothetical protein
MNVSLVDLTHYEPMLHSADKAGSSKTEADFKDANRESAGRLTGHVHHDTRSFPELLHGECGNWIKFWSWEWELCQGTKKYCKPANISLRTFNEQDKCTELPDTSD